MRIRRHPLFWAIFLLCAGAFLLLKNNGVFRDLGDALWGGIFVLMGLGFLAWFLMDRQRHWRAIAGFPLLAIGALIWLGWRGLGLGDWQAAALVFGVALGFWAVLLTHDDNWWALLPAGVLTLLAALNGFRARLDEAMWLAFFLLGLGLLFGLLYRLRLGQQDTGWAGLPAAAFLLIGVVSLASALKLTGLVAQWWPALLGVAGAAFLFLAVSQPTSETPASQTSVPGESAGVEPAAAVASPPPAQESPVDIYTLLAHQPKEASAGEPVAAEPAQDSSSTSGEAA